MFIFVILYDFCWLPAQFCYIIVYVRKVESCVQIADRCAPWKIATDGRSLGRSVGLGVEPNLGLMTRYVLLFHSYDLVIVGRPL
jgi:hypothetical protein